MVTLLAGRPLALRAVAPAAFPGPPLSLSLASTARTASLTLALTLALTLSRATVARTTVSARLAAIAGERQPRPARMLDAVAIDFPSRGAFCLRVPRCSLALRVAPLALLSLSTAPAALLAAPAAAFAALLRRALALSALLAPLLPGRGCGESGLEARDFPLLDGAIHQPLDLGEQRSLLGAHE